MRRALILIAASGLALLPAACGSGDGTASGPAPTPTTSTSTYENAGHGFALEHPEGWVVQEDPSTGAVVQLYAAESAGDGFAENVNLVIEEVPVDVTPTEYLDVGWAQLEPRLTEVEELGREELTVGGLPAASIEYLAHYPQAAGQLHFLQVAVVDGRTVFVLTYTGKDDGFDRYRAEAEGIIDSFHRT